MPIKGKFENKFLSWAANQGGTLFSAYKELKRLHDVKEAYFGDLGMLMNYDNLINDLSENDLDLLSQIKKKYNFPKLSEQW